MADCTVTLAGEDKTAVLAAGTPLAEALKELLSKKQRKQAVAFRFDGELHHPPFLISSYAEGTKRRLPELFRRVFSRTF